jgi:tRNA (adenine57-N1/adenine58-N1)-methyltransferase catalytic subunit
MASSFLTPHSHARPGDLASLHLRRDQSLSVILNTQVTTASDSGYAEGVVTNTRFGSFPHTTIIGAPWGSQIRASKVDTGSRGRTKGGKKRKVEELLEEDVGPIKDAVAAESGFVHVLPPTPENWTTSLPHRTQVVYTPDYSYILHRICARPGSRLIEAGSGSGSFTHAAARAVYNGRSPALTQHGKTNSESSSPEMAGNQSGNVFTYEFHRERHEKVKEEMHTHGLDTVVHAMHRDVYNDGFLIYDSDDFAEDQRQSPRANAIFLDLPAPWEALPHLTRGSSTHGQPSALDPELPVHICTFSPCIEQAQKTISALRRYDWIDIEMVEMQHKRIEVKREYTGLQYEGMRGANSFAVDVDEAVSRLKEVEQRLKEFHAVKNAENGGQQMKTKKQQQQQQQESNQKLPYNEGKVVHRTEPEIKTHTSYLVFAILPRAWTEADEAEMQAMYSSDVKISSNAPKSQRQLKKEAKKRSKEHKRIAL